MSAAALATLAGGGTANAGGGDVCLECGDFRFPQPGLNNAFFKLDIAGFPGSTESAFSKVGTQNAFVKLADLGFPGITGDIFEKQ